MIDFVAVHQIIDEMENRVQIGITLLEIKLWRKFVNAEMMESCPSHFNTARQFFTELAIKLDKQYAEKNQHGR